MWIEGYDSKLNNTQSDLGFYIDIWALYTLTLFHTPGDNHSYFHINPFWTRNGSNSGQNSIRLRILICIKLLGLWYRISWWHNKVRGCIGVGKSLQSRRQNLDQGVPFWGSLNIMTQQVSSFEVGLYSSGNITGEAIENNTAIDFITILKMNINILKSLLKDFINATTTCKIKYHYISTIYHNNIVGITINQSGTKVGPKWDPWTQARQSVTLCSAFSGNHSAF